MIISQCIFFLFQNLINVIYRNVKNVLPLIVDMSKHVSETIGQCQNFNPNLPAHRASSSSTGRRESTKRLSMKSPARGVVKPMVSGHTITKPVINLSRVNLSVIAEGPVTPERNLSRSVVSIEIKFKTIYSQSLFLSLNFFSY